MREPKRTIVEALIVAVAGIALALSANAMNPQGLKLGRDYFMMGGKPPATRPATAPSTPPASAVATRPAAQQAADPPDVSAAPSDVPPNTAADPFAGLSPQIRAKLEHFGLQPIRHAQVAELFNAPEYAAGFYAIIDAREPRDYAEGHIPGAHHIAYFDEQRYTPDVLPFAQAAEKVIFYCNGGECEDSVLTAVLLRDIYFLDPTRIVVYVEGFEGWKKAGMPVERGARNSGDMVEGDR